MFLQLVLRWSAWKQFQQSPMGLFGSNLHLFFPLLLPLATIASSFTPLVSALFSPLPARLLALVSIELVRDLSDKGVGVDAG